MGDVIHTLPAAAALRQAFPDATLGWVIEERWAELLCALRCPRLGPLSPQRPLVEKVHTLNTFRWRSSLLSSQTWEQIAAGLSELRAPRYEVAIDFQGAVRSALIAKWSGASSVYGMAQPWESIASMMYTRQVMTRGLHIIERNLSLAEAVAKQQLALPRVTLPHDECAEQKIEFWLRERGIESFALLNPGAGWGAKRWPTQRYADVAVQLARHGLKALINFGPGEEVLALSVRQASDGAAEAIFCSIADLIALTRRARLFIGGDTGPTHLAAALGIPVVAIFGPTNPARNGPFGTDSIVLRSPSSITSHARRSEPEEGLLQITVDDVVTASRKLLRNFRD